MTNQRYYYKRTQAGGAVLFVPIGGAIIFAVALAIFTGTLWGFFAASFFAILLVLFYNLTVTVDDRFIRLCYGAGLVRLKFRISQIQSSRIVRNRWYYGWGIRFIPSGMLYNISGLDAVELRLVSGRRVRIGTDEPLRLNGVIYRRLQDSKQPFSV